MEFYVEGFWNPGGIHFEIHSIHWNPVGIHARFDWNSVKHGIRGNSIWNLLYSIESL